ncbi:spore coat protein [Anaerobacillus sp. MEB173]|uniref:spore coat protein n=1 Tax=Anaerobacillus sp. MEB173 TaxID=3383345 RepID=UPI003F91A45B
MNQEYYSSKQHSSNDWSALSGEPHPFCKADEEDIEQEGVQQNKTLQLSEELIVIKDSCDVTVTSTDTKAALSLQASLQVVISIIISLSVANNETAERITQELLQSSKIKQITRQRTIIENSKNVNVTTTDAQIAAHIQVLAQILVAVVARLEIA